MNELAQNGKDLGRLLSDLLNHFRNLLIFQVSRGDLNLLEVSEAEIAALKEQSALANTESLTRILEVLTDSELRLRDAASRKILLEVALLKAIEARNAVSLDSVLKQLNQLRGQGGAGGPPAPLLPGRSGLRSSGCRAASANRNGRNSMPPMPAPQPAATLGRQSPVSADLAELWTRLIEAVGRVSPFTRSYLLDAHPVSFEKDILTIGFDPEFEDHLGLVDNARNHTLLQTKLAELGHANAQIKFIKAEAPAVRAATGAADAHRPSRLPRPNPPLPPRPPPGKNRRRAFQQRRFQERPADSKGAGNFQRPDRRSPRLTIAPAPKPRTQN